MELLRGLLRAFAVGGAFCVIAQILIDKTKLTPARILVAYVVAGVILGMVGVYAPLAEFAGAGATTPLTGFGFLISKGIKKSGGGKGIARSPHRCAHRSSGRDLRGAHLRLYCRLLYRQQAEIIKIGVSKTQFEFLIPRTTLVVSVAN